MESDPSASRSVSLVRKRGRKLGRLSVAEKQAIINCYKTCLEKEPNLSINTMVLEIANIQGKYIFFYV